jgi:hypothetical protein
MFILLFKMFDGGLEVFLRSGFCNALELKAFDIAEGQFWFDASNSVRA